MLSSDPKLPQLSQQEAASGSVPVGFYRRFQERFYTLWRELARNDERLRARVDGGKFNVVYVGDGTAALPSVTNQGDENTGLYFPAANEVSVTTNGVERLRVTSDGRVYGTALHNNSGAVTGTTNQYIASGTMASGNATGVTNITGTPTYSTMMWMRVGNVVTVAGTITAQATTGGFGTETVIRLPLPIASAFAAVEDCSGAGYWTSSSSNAAPVRVRADTTNDQAEVRWLASSTSAITFQIHFTYLIK